MDEYNQNSTFDSYYIGDKSLYEKYKSMSDEEIIKLHIDEPQAIDYILYKYKGFVKAMARRYFLMGGDCDDLIQEGMIGLYKAIRDYDSEKKVAFKTFSELCVIRQMISAIKAANRMKHRPLNGFVSLSKPVFEEENEKTLEEILKDKSVMSPEDIFIENEGFQVLEKKMKGSLSELEQQVVELYLAGRSYSDISEKLGKSIKSIDNALQRAKGKLVKLMEQSE